MTNEEKEKNLQSLVNRENMHQIIQMVNGEEIVSWENDFDVSPFTCYYCLEKFKDYDIFKAHEDSHPKNTKSQQMYGGW